MKRKKNSQFKFPQLRGVSSLKMAGFRPRQCVLHHFRREGDT